MSDKPEPQPSRYPVLHEATVLVADDVADNRELLFRTLEPHGCIVLAAPNGEAALNIASRRAPDVVLLDLAMPPGIDGFETCRRLKAQPALRDVPVIFVTAQHEVSSVVEGFHLGGVDYITKPFQAEEVLSRVATHVALSRMRRELAAKNAELTATNERLKAEIARRETAEASLQRADTALSIITEQEAARWGLSGFVGASPAFTALIEQVRAVQEFPRAGVLILGENGTGKELIARAIHFGGPRAKAPFIAVNCGRLTRDLAESELFGHVRGAFTGATSDRKGCFETAEGGTLFLDELGTMPLELQAKLLRVLEDHRLARLGSASERTIDVRVIAATNAKLEDQVRAGCFREDLYFRLKRFTLQVPALRERPEDIPILATHFCWLLATEMGLTPPPLSEEAVVVLRHYRFPGNVRELKNIVESALIQSRGREVRPEHLNLTSFASFPEKPAAPGNKDCSDVDSLNLREVELRTIRRAIANAGGNLAQAARLLGVDRGVIYRRLRESDEGQGDVNAGLS